MATSPPGRWAAFEMLIRFKALGFTLVMPLLGIVTVAARPDGAHLLAVLISAAAFHVFAYVLNDVIDLPIDRGEPLRAQYPLVRGAIRPAQALALALVQIPLCALLLAATGASTATWLCLGAAFGLMTSYNIWGKRCPFPPLTDVIQGLGWAALVVCGALAANATPNALTALIAAYVTLYIVMINGVHGSLRDLANDLRCGLRTTAIMLGARPSGAGLTLSPAILVYALALQLALIALPIAALLANPFAYTIEQQIIMLLVLAALAVVCLALLVAAARLAANGAAMMIAGGLHLSCSFLLPVALLAQYAGTGLLAVILTAFMGPLLTTNVLRRAAGRALRGRERKIEAEPI